MNDPRIWTTVQEFVGARDGMSGGGQREKHQENCNRITIKIIKNNRKKDYIFLICA